MPSSFLTTIGAFDATDEEGKTHRLLVFQEMIPSVVAEKASYEFVPGCRSIETLGGDPVERIAKGQYRELKTGRELSSSDPDAP